MHTKNAYFQQVTTQGNILHIDTNPLGISYPGSDAFDPINDSPFLAHDKKYSVPTSPGGSSCTSSGHGSPRKDTPHSRCHLIRRNTNTTNTPASSIASPTVSAKSWDHIKSPAASFLASFAASPPVSSLPSSLSAAVCADEQDGDELDDYVLDKVIGQGGFSRVRSGYCITDGRKVAVKVTSQERELSIWKQLDHPNVLAMEKLLETDAHCYAVCTYCGGGTLLDLVNERQRISEAEARCIVRQLASGLEYLHHEARVVHKDLKLDNVLLMDDKQTVKIGDFGLAVYQQPVTQQLNEHAGGSPAYTSPEQIRTPWVISSPSTDMWSLGVILYAMVAGRLPFDDLYDARLQQKILAGQFDMPHDISPSLASLISGLLHVDPQQRLTARQVLDSAWCNMAA